MGWENGSGPVAVAIAPSRAILVLLYFLQAGERVPGPVVCGLRLFAGKDESTRPATSCMYRSVVCMAKSRQIVCSVLASRLYFADMMDLQPAALVAALAVRQFCRASHSVACNDFVSNRRWHRLAFTAGGAGRR